MSITPNFKCAQGTAGADIVINIDGSISCPRQMQFVCVSGTIEVEGEGGNLFGLATLPASPVIITAGNSMNFNEGNYSLLKITIKSGAEYQILTNQ